MCRLFETIKIDDGIIQYPEYHEQRMKSSMNEIFHLNSDFNLNNKLRIPDHFKTGIVKCKVFYSSRIEAVEYSYYHQKTINKLRIVEDDIIEYNFKFTDRYCLDKLLELRGDCDDIIIVKNGMLSDTSYSNLAFFDGTNWYTPGTPLLPGTRRKRMILSGELLEADIRPLDIHNFEGVKLINAMLGLEDQELIKIDMICQGTSSSY